MGLAVACPCTVVEARTSNAGQHHTSITVPAQPLSRALADLARQTGISIGTEGTLPTIRTRPCRNAGSVEEALEHMLDKSGFAARRLGPDTWRIVAATGPAAPRTHRFAPGMIDPDPIIVTAAKQSIALRDIARSVSVLDLTDTQRGDALSASMTVARNLDGMTMTALGPGRNRMFLRGVADSPFNGTSQSTVAVMLDDARLTYAAPDPDLRLVDVERVELLKGPQGSLYGTGALGGIYHIVTRRADPDRFEADVTAGLNALSAGGLGPNGSAMVNLPLVKGKAGLRLVAYASDEPGWIDTGSRKDSNVTRVTGERATLGVDAGHGWRIDVGGLAQNIDAQDSQYVYAPGSRSRAAQQPEPHDNDLYHGSLEAKGRIGGMDAVLVTGLSWQEVRDQLDATQGAQSFGLADPGQFIDDRHYHVWDSEIRLNGKLGAITWLAGLSYLQAGEHEERLLHTLDGAGVLTIDTTRRRASDAGLYLNATFPLTDRLDIEGGGRLFRSMLDVLRASSSVQASQEITRIGITPSAALAWRPHAGRTIYARYDSAFRQGGLDFENSGKIHAYPGDEVTTFEVGWREQLPAGGKFEANAFYNWWDNLQSDTLEPNGLIETRTAGEARIIGTEISLSLPIGSSLQLSLGATTQSARLIRNVLGLALEDTRLPAIPDYTLRGSLERGFRLAGGKGRLRLDLRYTGPSRLSFEPQLDRRMGNVLDSQIETGVTWTRTTLSISLVNLLGRSGNIFSYGNPFRALQAQYTPQPPTSLRMMISRRF